MGGGCKVEGVGAQEGGAPPPQAARGEQEVRC